MRSMAISRFGDSDVFETINLPKPNATSGHVVIKVNATSVNPFDYKLRKGFFPDLIPSFPAVLHGDIAGVIEQVGDNVTDFAIGDEVYGCIGGILNMSGGLSEYVLADANLIAHKPKKLSMREAAALPLVALTAWEALITYANVQKDQTVLVHGGTGGVGHIAVQLAKWLGAKVYATSSSANKLFIAKQLGADVVINYKDSSVQDYVNEYTQGAGFDVVFDTVGGANLPECFAAAALFGKVISILAVGNYDITPAYLKGLTLHTVLQPLPLMTGKRRAEYKKILTTIAALVDEGVIKPLVDEKKFTLNEVGDAHNHLENGAAIGKVVLTLI